MTDPALYELLSCLRTSIDRLIDELDRDRPELARAVERHTDWIPTPDEARDRIFSVGAARPIAPVLYEALDAGALDGRELDRVVLRHERARRELADRATASRPSETPGRCGAARPEGAP